MKILKYTFQIPQLIVDDGELLENGYIEETHTFTLLFKGVGLYEKLAGKPLLTDLTEYSKRNTDGQIDVEFVKNIACASWCKIVDDSVHQNVVTAEEFRKSDVFNVVSTDTDFMKQLLEMMTDCVLSEKQKQQTKGYVATKK